jgi:nitrite reductase/ring-hydroxylating ferredoxin subunit
MTQSNAASASKVPLQITDPERIPSRRYYDAEFYKLECERLWPHVWQMACRLEQIPNVGDWVEYTILDKSVIVVRSKDGVKAFHNACRHRGVQLVEAGSYGNAQSQGFVCPFHGWRFSINGDNTFVYGKHMFGERQLDKADLALKPCRVELWGGCAFINLDDNAPSFRDTIGPVADRIEAHGMSKLRSEWWYATELPANWKVAMEAFMEGFHVMKTHPQLHKACPALYNNMYGNETGGIGSHAASDMSVREHIKAEFEQLALLSTGMAGMMHAKEVEIARQLLDIDLPDDVAQAVPMWFGAVAAEITKQLQARGEPVPDLLAVAVSDPIKAVEFLFPNYFLLSMFSSMSSYRIRPLGPESCLFEIWSLTHAAPGQEPIVPMQPTVLPYDSSQFPPIPQQDYGNIPLQQKGLHAGGFEYMRLGKNIEGLISNYQRVIDGYLMGVKADKLASATHLLGGNFDGKILDLGF